MGGSLLFSSLGQLRIERPDHGPPRVWANLDTQKVVYLRTTLALSTLTWSILNLMPSVQEEQIAQALRHVEDIILARSDRALTAA